MFTQALRNQPLDAMRRSHIRRAGGNPRAHGPLTAIATLTSTNYPVESQGRLRASVSRGPQSTRRLPCDPVVVSDARPARGDALHRP